MLLRDVAFMHAFVYRSQCPGWWVVYWGSFCGALVAVTLACFQFSKCDDLEDGVNEIIEKFEIETKQEIMHQMVFC